MPSQKLRHSTLIQNGTAAQSDFDGIQKRVREDVDRATDEAERSPMPNPQDAGRGLFAGDGYWMAETIYLDATTQAMSEEMERDENPAPVLNAPPYPPTSSPIRNTREMQFIAFDCLDAPIKRVASLDVPTPYSPPLEAAWMPNRDKVLAAARELLAY